MSFWNTSSSTVAADTMGGSFPPDAPVPQNTGSIPLVAMGGGVPPHVVPVPMGGGIPLHMGGGVPAPVPGAAPPRTSLEGMVPPQALFPQVSVPVDGALLPHAPLPAVSGVPSPDPPMVMIRMAEPFKLPTMKDAKANLHRYSIIQCYLHHPEFSTQQADDALITDSQKLEASCFSEGQIHVAVQDGSLCFLFENKGS
jgi:hypothetical protein